ncbi:MAG TPA: hypothetical protein VMR74_10360 [Gammaproteobacteria bacterium]|nr:hypothetical protein [Gammaproteobacteria bacterium]
MDKYLTPALIGGLVAAATLVALVVVLWPPGLAAGILLSILAGLLAVALAFHVARRKRYRPEWKFRPGQAGGMTEAELAEWRNRALIDREQRLELRELQLARQTRALQRVNEDYLDVLDSEPTAEELGALVETDRRVIALIESESQRAFDRVLANRYAAPEGVNTALILADVRSFVEQVARLYRPDTEHPLLETEIELIAKSLSSAALHVLVVVDALPINLKSYNAARMYRLIRRGASYYGTYKSFRPYIEHGLNVLQMARLAFGVNPAAVAAAWAAGKLTSYGAKAIGERLLQRQALGLLTDFVRVIGFEAAMVYGGGFRHRDANWLLGAALVNLEVSRGADLAGRDAALVKLCNLALRHEFDRVRLLHHLAKHKSIDIARARPRIIMTGNERDEAAAVLTAHCRATGVDLTDEKIARWRESLESILDVMLDLPPSPPVKPRRRAGRWFDRIGRKGGRRKRSS